MYDAVNPGFQPNHHRKSSRRSLSTAGSTRKCTIIVKLKVGAHDLYVGRGGRLIESFQTQLQSVDEEAAMNDSLHERSEASKPKLGHKGLAVYREGK